jgi:hypothetical protein
MKRYFYLVLTPPSRYFFFLSDFIILYIKVSFVAYDGLIVLTLPCYNSNILFFYYRDTLKLNNTKYFLENYLKQNFCKSFRKKVILTGWLCGGTREVCHQELLTSWQIFPNKRMEQAAASGN